MNIEPLNAMLEKLMEEAKFSDMMYWIDEELEDDEANYVKSILRSMFN